MSIQIANLQLIEERRIHAMLGPAAAVVPQQFLGSKPDVAVDGMVLSLPGLKWGPNSKLFCIVGAVVSP